MKARAEKPTYAGKVALRHAIEVAETVWEVGGFELCPDGTIRILRASAMPKKPADEFEAWDAAGRL